VIAGIPAQRLSAITGCEQSLQNNPYSITSSARAISILLVRGFI
jgi:hypothetical protein